VVEGGRGSPVQEMIPSKFFDYEIGETFSATSRCSTSSCAR
jgi:hypothetical protein